MIKRIGLFLITNFLVMISVMLLLQVFHVTPYLTKQGLNISSLLIFCLMWGMVGSLISLSLSRIMAKRIMGVRVLSPNQVKNNWEVRLISHVYSLAHQAGLKTMPEVGVYDSAEINAFATGPTKSRALVAVSTGLLANLNEEQVQGVLAHEISHIVNGDMVTMTLLQGVVNAFVMFLARIVASVITSTNNQNGRHRSGFLYFLVVWVLEIGFMILGSLVVSAFSRYREYRADAGGANLTSKQTMINTLQALQNQVAPVDPRGSKNLAAFKISGQGLKELFASHPSLSKRIKALQ